MILCGVVSQRVSIFRESFSGVDREPEIRDIRDQNGALVVIVDENLNMKF